jgi:hypothetical protein
MPHGPGISFLKFKTGAGHAVQQCREKGIKPSGAARAGHPFFFPARPCKPGGNPIHLRDSGPCDDHPEGIYKNLSGMVNDGRGEGAEIRFRQKSAKHGKWS